MPVHLPALERLRPRDPSWRFLRAVAGRQIARDAVLTVEGAGYLPPTGPVVVAAHHYHHLLDGCALIATSDRPAHIVVGLDWAEGGVGRLMRGLCKVARWPVVYRPPLDAEEEEAGQIDAVARFGAFRIALRESTKLLREGRVLIVFPEGYPVIDPNRTPKVDGAFLPFQSGVVRIARAAEAACVAERHVPLVPAGFRYEALSSRRRKGPAWHVVMAFGPPRFRADFPDDAAVLAALQEDVFRLSGAPDVTERA